MQTTKLEPTRTERMALVRQLRELRVALGLVLPWTRPQIGSFPDGSLTIRLDHMPGGSGALMIGPGSLGLWYLSELRLEMGNRLGLRNPEVYAAHWVLDFPLLEFGEEDNRWFAMHHPFTAPKPADLKYLETGELGKIRANAYDLVINGVEVGGGSIRIFQKELQAQMFGILGFSPEEAKNQFGFLMDAFEFGAPPHGGLAFGFDRLCSLFGGSDSIRDFIAFPKNNSGRDVMIDSPSKIDQKQLDELKIKTLV